MSPSELVGQAIEKPSEAAFLLATAPSRAGISQAFFEVVYDLYSQDHAKLRDLEGMTAAVLKYGDDRALGYRCKGIVERSAGRWQTSAAAFLRAGSLALNPISQLSFKIGAIDSLARAGKVSDAVKLGHELADRLGELGETGLALRARLNIGYALMEQDRFQEAAQELQGLPDQLQANDYLVDAASSSLALSTCLLFSGETKAARDMAAWAEAQASEQGSHLLAAIAEANLAYTDILFGNPDLAVARLIELKTKHAEEPVELARVLEYLGDAYGAMGLFREAIDAYKEAESVNEGVSQLHRAHIKMGLGLAEAGQGKLEMARECFQFAVEGYKRLSNLPWLAAAEGESVAIDLELGNPGAKRRLLGVLQRARLRAYPVHLCRILIESAEHGGSDSELKEAEALAKRWHLPSLGWRIHAERARRVQGAARLREYRKMFRMMEADHLRVSSFAARQTFFTGKQVPLRDYVEELLAHPSKRRLSEALNVLARSRGIALLDEVLSARKASVSDSVRQSLVELREHLSSTPQTPSGNGTRKLSPYVKDLDHWQRRWIEETFEMEASSESATGTISVPEDSFLYVQSRKQIRIASNSGVLNVPLPDQSLQKRLNWMQYDLLAPQADPGASPAQAMKQLKELGELVLGPIVSSGKTLGICPEGALWNIPWIACLDAMGATNDLELRLHPGLRGTTAPVAGRPAMLWIASHSDLPQAQREAEQFLEIHPDALICRSAAEVRRVMRTTKVGLLHVVSHSRHRSTHPMFSTLDFTDGPVFAAEVARSGLRASLVTLSGCDTGRMSGENSLEPDGLVRAFLACGAGYVVGSAWPLDDESAMRFYSRFFKSYGSAANIHESLREAREAVRQWRDHPYYWAFPLLFSGYQS